MISSKSQHFRNLVILLMIWLGVAIGDRLWYGVDNSVPAWDQADYLNGALNYGHALQNTHLLDLEWWRSFWLLSNKIPPLHYILTAPFLSIFGLTEDSASLVMLLYTALLLISVYGLGVILFDASVGLWAAGLCQLLPGLYYYRLEFLLDYPLTAIVTATFWLLTLWKVKQKNWILAILWGISLGLAVLLKQTALFFLFIPLVWLWCGCLKNRHWMKLTQLFTGLVISVAVAYPWYRTNWLLILTSGKRATIDSAIAEGDPALNTIDAWTYYGKILPYLLSWHILLIPLGGLILYIILQKPHKTILNSNSLRWIAVFLIGGYLLSSVNINKDARYILPLLPVFSLILAVGLLSYRGTWQKYISWGTVGLGIVLMILNLFPLGGNIVTEKLSPKVQQYPYTALEYPHPEVIAEIINTNPYLRTTLGVLPSTPGINQHNFSFYGGLKNFQVVGRQVGVRDNEIIADARSLDWFITKTGDQGSIPNAQKTITQLVETGGDFTIQKTWQLPDNSQLKLYHSIQPSLKVTPVEASSESVTLNQITIPPTAPPGKPIPVTYQWVGSWQKLQQGIVLLTWKSDNLVSNTNIWLHDHGIGMGALDSSSIKKEQYQNTFQVTEHTAMLPPQNITPGEYTLTATYLNRQTGETSPISLPSISITIDSNSPAKPSPELDLVTQLRTIAPTMAQGIAALEPIFAQTARINQYDGKQDYLNQAELSLSYRLQQKDIPETLQQDWIYAVGLSQVLQQDVKGAIASFKKTIQFNQDNPYNYAYLAFVYLYDWKPRLAEAVLNKAIAIDSDIPEINTLRAVAALMQGKLIQAWQLLES
ncbi:MAG: glycosyltransferase family 39 protein [Xenococcaceae cyanobacterium MO_207.B15]|nr:glycosyltransferase family 39 protein [Xenococcaceae cyanobacterium MO_207.B15]